MNKGILTCALLLLAGCATNAPKDLKCDYQDGNVLVDVTATPRLSWINSTDQTACQIIVSTDKEGKDILWDSGKTDSGESHLVPYSGPGMEPMKD